MKIAIVTDMHIGVRGDSKIFLDHQERFFSEVFFPYIDEHDIKIIFDLGDTFDRRKFNIRILISTKMSVKNCKLDLLNF